MPDSLSRRDILRTLTMGGVASYALRAIPLAAAEHAHRLIKDEKKSAANLYTLKFFSSHQYKTLQALCQAIIPADQDSGGAIEAGAIKAIKHAFNGTTKDGQITVAFDVSETDWKLSVTGNGIGNPAVVFAQPKTGLGTGIVNALAKQLDAKVETLSGPRGTSVSVTHATFAAKQTRAA